jgi:hypothetical protein
MSNLEAALAYAARGWFIYPARDKARALVNWGTESSNDPEQIRKWWTKYPNAVICLNCGLSGIAVVDLDIKDGKNGPAALAALEAIHGRLPRTLTQTTSSGGTHLIFRGTIKTTVGRPGYALGDGIDTRGVGGMAVLAPSRIKGKPYVMFDDEELGAVLEPVGLPQWVADLAGRSVKVEKGDGVFVARYTEAEFAALLKHNPVERYDNDHDAWLEFMLACTHASTVDDGRVAFMEWTLADGPGNRIGFSCDAAEIESRWEYNFARRCMKGGVKVGTFHKHLIAADPNVILKGPSAAEDFAEPEPPLSPAEEAAQRRYDRANRKRREAYLRDTTVQPLLKKPC